ncbi:MAG: UPF0280 family protein [Pseudomonadota bacterium]
MAKKTPERYRERLYRREATAGPLVSFEVQVRQSDLHIRATTDLSQLARDSLLQHRAELESFIARSPSFVASLVPLPLDPLAPLVARAMLEAALVVGVGPMAAVAGAIAEVVGRDLLASTPEVIVENGGDVWLRVSSPGISSAIFAGASPLSGRVGLAIHPELCPLAICTSSATVGHSLSLGRADAAVALAASGALADAAATAIGNAVNGARGIEAGLAVAAGIEGLLGAVVIRGARLGAWGEAVELVSL